MEFIEKNKILLIGALIALGAVVVFVVMGGGATGTVSGSATLDQSRKVESSVKGNTGGDSTDIKVGGGIGGDFNINQSKNSKK